MVRLLKLLIVLIVLAGIGVVGFAYLGDLSPEQDDFSAPVEFDGS